MDGSDTARRVSFEVERLSEVCRDTNEERTDDTNYHAGVGGSQDINRHSCASRAHHGTLNTRLEGGTNISMEELASNPLVIELMERLVHLEGR